MDTISKEEFNNKVQKVFDNHQKSILEKNIQSHKIKQHLIQLLRNI